MSEQDLRAALVAASRTMETAGLNTGTAGNISARLGDDMLITPSGVPNDALSPDGLAVMKLEPGDEPIWKGPFKPSSEWRFHRDVLRARGDVGAIVHAHAPYATALAIARKPIPPCHYMIAAFGGADIRCGDYALFGTQALSDIATQALVDRNGCLLANHGMIAIGRDLPHALWLAVELENLARQYWLSLQIGGPVLLTETEIAEAREKFAHYGLNAQKA
ncbi:MAG: class II aldolase/adducin family protein [Hyphomicrobiales bacterium]|nr:class II aldolase/adducin family protein [Hyphomicrobiales bacterium]